MVKCFNSKDQVPKLTVEESQNSNRKIDSEEEQP